MPSPHGASVLHDEHSTPPPQSEPPPLVPVPVPPLEMHCDVTRQIATRQL